MSVNPDESSVPRHVLAVGLFAIFFFAFFCESRWRMKSRIKAVVAANL